MPVMITPAKKVMDKVSLREPTIVDPGSAYAGFWRRVAAYLIDVALLAAVEAVLVFTVMETTHGDLQALASVISLGSALQWAYFAVLESSPARATVGKIALDIYVGDKHGDPIGFGRASVRFWLKSLSTLTLMLGWLMAAFTPQKQALHDVMAGTLVLRRHRLHELLPQQPGEPFAEYWDGKQWVGPS